MGLFQIKKYFFYLIVSLWLFNLFSCSVREHDNVFDPKSGIDSLNFELILTKADSLISFFWYPPGNVDYQGFHIYRRVLGQDKFSSRAVLNSKQTTFTDTVVSFDFKYFYYLTLIGQSGESPPTKILATIPGPGTIWVLDRWDEYIYKYSYDLQHHYLKHYAIWIPQDLAFNKKEHQALITYPLFHYAELIDAKSGQLINDINDLKYPYACAFHPLQKSFWISDSGGYLYRFQAGNLQNKRLIDDGLNKPVTVAIDADGLVYVLDAGLNQILLYNAGGSKVDAITDPWKITFVTVNHKTNQVYFISKKADSAKLYQYLTLSKEKKLILKEQNIDLIRQSSYDQTLWLVQNFENSARIVQLSVDGLRLKNLNGYKKIEDLAVNPYNGNLVVADRGAHQVVHLSLTGEIIGKLSNAPFPFRIIIQ